MERFLKDSDVVFAMSNIRGNKVRVEDPLPFSFFYSPKMSSHGPRVKPVFDPQKMRIENAGTLKLCDNWRYIPGKNDNPSDKQIEEMKAFFRKYLVVFLLVWDNLVDEPDADEYFKGEITLQEFIACLDFYQDNKEVLDSVKTIGQLEDVCREFNLLDFLIVVLLKRDFFML